MPDEVRLWSLAANFTFYSARTFVILNIVYGIYTGNLPGIGAYVTMMLAIGRLTDTMNDLFYYVKDFNRLGLYAAKIRSFFDVKPGIEAETQKQHMAPCGPYSVEFNDVRFTYENSAFAISNLNLK
jgi:ABC-type multidrug transport system fused ATPase/permease subunit